MRKISLTQGKFALVDDEDYAELNRYQWQANKSGKGEWYAKRMDRWRGRRVKVYMHRAIAMPTVGMEIDHKNHNGLDNRKCNLRSVTRAQNTHNQRPWRNSASSYRGVKRSGSERNPWRASVAVDGKEINLGCHPTEVAAALAWNEAARKYYGKHGYQNDVKDSEE